MSAAFHWPVDLDAQREDELRAELDAAGPMKLEEIVTDGLYSFSQKPGDTDGRRRLGVLLVALREADARAALPRDVALAFDLLLATVIDNTLAHRANRREIRAAVQRDRTPRTAADELADLRRDRHFREHFAELHASLFSDEDTNECDPLRPETWSSEQWDKDI